MAWAAPGEVRRAPARTWVDHARVVEPVLERDGVVVVVAQVDAEPELDAACPGARGEVRVTDLALDVVVRPGERGVRVGSEILRAAEVPEVLRLAHESTDAAGVPEIEVRVAHADDLPAVPPEDHTTGGRAGSARRCMRYRRRTARIRRHDADKQEGKRDQGRDESCGDSRAAAVTAIRAIRRDRAAARERDKEISSHSTSIDPSAG